MLSYLNWVAAFLHHSIHAWCDTEWSCRLADHQIMYKSTFSVSLLPQDAWQPWQLLLLWLECGRDVTHSGSAGTTNSRSLTGKLSYIICNYSLWNSVPGKWALNESCCFCMWGICFPVTQTGVRHHEISSVLVNKQILNSTQGQQGSQCIMVLLCCLAWNLLQKFPRLVVVNLNATSLLYVCTESFA